MIIQTQTATPIELEPPITSPVQTKTNTNIGTDVTATAEIELASNFVMEGSVTIGSKQMKKRSGRPRTQKGRHRGTKKSQILTSMGKFRTLVWCFLFDYEF